MSSDLEKLKELYNEKANNLIETIDIVDLDDEKVLKIKMV